MTSNFHPSAICMRAAWTLLATGLVFSSCAIERMPTRIGATPAGPGATVRYDLGHRPLPEIPLPNDVATWPDPSSRTGLRINASLIAPTAIERQARERFSQMEGWGTFAPIAVSFDVDTSDPDYKDYDQPAVDLANVKARHQNDDYDFQNDAIYLVNLDTGVPAVLDVGAGNFAYALKKLDRYWPNDSRRSERNLLFETIDETSGGSILEYAPEHDSDFDGVLDRPNFEQLGACTGPDPICDSPQSGDAYDTAECIEKRRERDRCIADNLLYWYERETDTLLVRPLLPLDEMSRYAVVITDRLLDGRGNAVKSPFDFIYHATQYSTAERVAAIIDDPTLQTYFGDIHGTGLGRIAFLWRFTTQATVDDLKRLRDGLYGYGPFARWGEQYPAELELQRLVGLTAGLAEGATDTEDWVNSELGEAATCADKASNLYVVDYDGLRPAMRNLVEQGFGVDAGPASQLLLRRLEAIDHMVIASYKVPFLLEGGPNSTDPNAAFNLNYQTGEGFESQDTVQVWMLVPKETEQHKQPFDVNIYGHGYTGNFIEMILYAGNMAEHGLATVGINAMGHGLDFGDDALELAAGALLGGVCYKPLADALTLGRARDLNQDGLIDSGGDFWSSYLFHTRDGVRQSVIDHLQLVRIMHSFGSANGTMACRNDADHDAPVQPCDFDHDGQEEVLGDFDGDGTADLGGPEAHLGTWGESLGGVLSAIHGAIDPYVSSAVPGSGGGGLTDIGVRSFQGGVIEAVLLRLWGPLIVGIPASDRKSCSPSSDTDSDCTICSEQQLSMRWVLPNINDTGEVEFGCLETGTISDTTVLVRNLDNDELRCSRVSDDGRFRIGLPSSTGDRVAISFWDGKDAVNSYEDCAVVANSGLRHSIETWGAGRFLEGAVNQTETASCSSTTCSNFQGHFFGEGQPLTAPGDGLGLIRQTPGLRRFLTLAQAALEPGDPISFAPYYALKAMYGPDGEKLDPHAVFTLNTIGDMNVPVNTGIAFARASGALPFMRPAQASLYPEYANFITPQELYTALGGTTPNQALIERHVIEGITSHARHPAAAECAESANFLSDAATFLDAEGNAVACLPAGCTSETESSDATRLCWSGTTCDLVSATCVPKALGQTKCDEALWDSDDIDENKQQYFEQFSSVPHRLARLSSNARDSSVDEVWSPRLSGIPFSPDDNAWLPPSAPEGRLTALLNAYVVPEGVHTFSNGNPCEAFDTATYLTNLVARFFQSDGTDIYYLSHPSSHHCLASASPSCSYASTSP